MFWMWVIVLSAFAVLILLVAFQRWYERAAAVSTVRSLADVREQMRTLKTHVPRVMDDEDDDLDWYEEGESLEEDDNQDSEPLSNNEDRSRGL